MWGTVKRALNHVTRNILFILIGLQFVLFSFLSLILRAWMKLHAGVSVSLDITYSLIVIALLALLAWTFYKIIDAAPKAKKRFAALLPYLISFALQAAIIFLIPSNEVRGDALKVRNAAMQVAQGNFQAFEPAKYLSEYPNNIGITLFYALFFLVLPKSCFVLRVINLAFNLLTMFYTVKLYHLVFPERPGYASAFRYFMLLFLPAAFLVTYTYGDIPSVFFSTAAIYYAIRYVKTKNFKNCLLTAGMIFVAYFLKQIALLAAVSIFLYWIYMFFFRYKALRIGTLSVIAVLAVFLAFQVTAVDFVFRQLGCWNTPVYTNSQPVTRWLHIGIPDNRQYGYWDLGQTTHQYHLVNGDRSKLDRILTDEIRDSLTKTPPQRLVSGYMVKDYWLWSEGTFESIKYGLHEVPKGNYIYDNGSLKTFLDLLYTYVKAHYILILFLSGLCFLLKKTGLGDEKNLFGFMIACFFGFYLLWEMKSRYLLPLYPVLLLTSFGMMTNVYERIRDRIVKKRARLKSGGLSEKI